MAAGAGSQTAAIGTVVRPSGRGAGRPRSTGLARAPSDRRAAAVAADRAEAATSRSRAVTAEQRAAAIALFAARRRPQR